MSGLHDVLQHPSIWRASDAQQQSACDQQTEHTTATGFPQLDKELPNQGWPQNELSEFLSPHWGMGELQLLSPALAQLSQQERWIAWISPPWQPYGPALIQQGVNTRNLLLIHTKTDKERLWAMETCLQSGACSLVLGWPHKILPQHIKRLHLAAKKGKSWCLLMRHSDCAQQPSPAPLRMTARMSGAHFELRLIKRRGSWTSHWIQFPNLLSAPRLSAQQPTQSSSTDSSNTTDIKTRDNHSRTHIVTSHMTRHEQPHSTTHTPSSN